MHVMKVNNGGGDQIGRDESTRWLNVSIRFELATLAKVTISQMSETVRVF